MSQTVTEAPEKHAYHPSQRRPRDAATLILTRMVGGKLAVLMGQRSRGHVFQPEMYVFPGGRVDRADAFAAAASELRPEIAAHLGRSVTPRRARALPLAAVRELFEETGLVLGAAHPAPARPPSSWAPFYATGCAPALDRVDYLFRAITPPGRPRRFDTRFFWADGAAAEGALGGSGELLFLDWLPVADAKALPLPAITQYVLHNLNALMSLNRDGGARRPVPFFRMTRGERHYGTD